VLVSLEVEPGMFRASREASAALVDAVARLLPRTEADGAEDSHTTLDESTGEPSAESTTVESSPPDSRRRETRGADEGDEDERDENTLPESARQRGFTRFGGLMYLLGVIEDVGLHEEMAAHALLSERTLRWTLQQVALRLMPLDADDAAALAFAGLRPEEVAPAEHEAPPDDAEAAVLDSFVARIVAALRVRLERPEQAADELLRFVCLRRAEVVAEPGWIDVYMSLDEVSTEIRRAGLDLNPGYVAWLGVVVRFVYE
jgi:hypothetical protein